MKKLLSVLAVTGLIAGATMPAYAGSDNAAEGKGIGQGEKSDKGSSGDAPGKNDATGKDNAPGQNKGE
jgi:hypothetical protein